MSFLMSDKSFLFGIEVGKKSVPTWEIAQSSLFYKHGFIICTLAHYFKYLPPPLFSLPLHSSQKRLSKKVTYKELVFILT